MVCVELQGSPRAPGKAPEGGATCLSSQGISGFIFSTGVRHTSVEGPIGRV